MLLENLYKEQKNAISFVRLLLALCVVVSHSFKLLKMNGEPQLHDLDGSPMNLGYFAVRAFFALSGFVIAISALSNDDPKRFLGARIARILPGYFFSLAGVFFVVVPCLIVFFGSEATSWEDVYGSLARFVLIAFLIPIAAPVGLEGLNSGTHLEVAVGIPLNASLWTLPLEIKSYLIIWLLLRFRVSLKYLWVVFLLVFCLLLAKSFLPDVFNLLIPDVSLILTFLTGSIIAVYFRKRKVSNLGLATVLLAASFFLVILQKELADVLVGLIISLVFPMIIYLLKIRFTWYRADYSYGTYLWGWPIGTLVSVFSDSSMPLMNLFLCIGLSVALGILSWHTVESRFLIPK